MIDAGLPCSIDTERFVLGAILLDRSMDSARAALDPDDFSLEKHRRIWRAMCEVYDHGRNPEYLDVALELDRRSERESVGGLTYLIDLTDGIPQHVNLDSHIGVLHEKTNLRRIALAAQNLLQRTLAGDENSAELRDALIAMGVDLGTHSIGKHPISTRELIDTIGLDDLLKPRRNEGIRLPWSRLNDALCGLHPGQMITLAAATGRGKTSFALQTAAHCTRQAKAAIYWTLEMPPEQLFRRIINQMAHLDADRWRHDVLATDEKDRQRDAAFWIYDHPIYFDAHSRNITSFLASVRQVQAKSDVGLVIVDYLQLIRMSGKAESRTREVGENSRSLKLAAMDLRLPFLVMSQFRRIESDRDYTIHDLKETGDIENDSDVILVMNGPKMDGNNEIDVRVNIGKQREGPTGYDVMLRFRPNSQTFYSTED